MSDVGGGRSRWRDRVYRVGELLVLVRFLRHCWSLFVSLLVLSSIIHCC